MDPPVNGGDQLLGFTGMVDTGIDPAEAWRGIHRSCQDPEIAAIFADLAADADGRAVLEYSRQRWAEQGFPPPWDPDAEVS